MLVLKKSLFLFCLIVHSIRCADLPAISLSSMQVIPNINSQPSMINSVDFHPTQNLFCATFTHNDQVVFYKLDKNEKWNIYQVLHNPSSQLSCPQHALFSKDGSCLIVANWSNQTFTVYLANTKGFYDLKPNAVIRYSVDLDDNYKPHGMAFSPEGNYLAVAFGASKLEPRAVVLYEVSRLKSKQVRFKPVYILKSEELDRGIPKGIAFSPDGSCLVVTLAETDSAVIYPIDRANGHSFGSVRQILKGPAVNLCRPEDIKFTNDGNICAISNSMDNSITFYDFDKIRNVFSNEYPTYILTDSAGNLEFPHGLAFSSDGNFFSVSRFGNVTFNRDGNLSSWAKERREAISVYRLK